ncbi:helix-turn-helix domain-containing protein [Lederbergia sp. NSJ-179]|uniref:helix-turn-helix domain-containing protein n=1 Tax=Lederbergia sp. NSJ-179 TaxID=2931402 RepID=UPI001FD59DBE|nr:helix-turn-helix domain-containing protein [Lederbergia sp. NSJ-179]MCJ7840754.1 helix-turn-helix domain-containing protein [Lederbergia sp. NSJ-179]
MNRNWFYRMLLAYTPVFFIIILILFFIFFQVLNDQSKQEALNINESLAGQAYRYMDRSLKEINHRVLRESLNNKSFQQFLNEQDIADVPVNLEAYKAMRELKINYPIIDSAYLVRFSDDTVLSLSTITKVKDYGDHLFIENTPTQHTSHWTDLRLFREFPKQKEKAVVSIKRPVPFYGKAKGFIVVNVSVRELKKGIHEMYDPEVSFVRLTDKSGTELWNEDVQKEKDRVLTRFTSDYTGWTIESGLSKSNLARVVDSVRLLWIIISFLVVVTGIIWFIYITKKAYKPLEQLVGKIHAGLLREQLVPAQKNEFTLIAQTLDQMMEQSNRYHQVEDEVLVLRRKYGFNKILHEKGTFPDWEEEMDKLGLPQRFLPSIVFLLEIDQYGEWTKKLNTEKRLQLKAELEKRASEHANDGGAVLWCGWENEDRLVGIMQASTEEMNLSPNFAPFKNMIMDSFPFTVTIGFSRVITIPEDLPKAYDEAEEALTYKAVLGLDQLIGYEEATFTEADIYQQLKLAHEIVIAYRISDNSWQKHYRKLFEQMKQAKLRKDELVHIINFFIFYLERERHLFPEDIQEKWNEQVLPRLADQLEHFDTMDELEQNIFTILDELAKEIITLKQAKSYDKVLLEIKEYIESHFENVDLSLDHLSELFDIRGKYISKLFKEQFGEKFVDFLTRIRMEHAEELLKTTNKPIVEISKQVGYISPNSFTRVFRKRHGTSPGEYRKLHNKMDGS